MRLFDSHCHLNLSAFAEDLEAVIARAQMAGVEGMLVVGTDLNDSIRALELAHKYPGIYAAIGIHPHDSQSADETLYSRLSSLAAAEKVVAYGEIGLDFYRDHSPRPVQRRAFARQLNLAGELGLPVIIHDREAHQEVYDLIRAESGYRHGGVIHCFSADYDWARRFVDLGFAISLPGTITYPRSQVQAEVARKLSLDDLLLETDAPFLSPVPYRGKRNEPAYVGYVAAAVAGLKKLDPEEVAARTSANCGRVFNLDV
ncbi:MAG TPA: TatD family deoxyribonuclease [Proteobacteria bacterium]|nr:TatD family deoxyribonuclease [Pseudomonadota bacterium]